MGSWVTYGLGTENQNLPGFVVLISGPSDPSAGKSLWGSGFLPSVYQGVQCRSVGDPILFVSNPPGMTRDTRRATLDALPPAQRDTNSRRSAIRRRSRASTNTSSPIACRCRCPR